MKKLLRTPELIGQGSGRLFECDSAPGGTPANTQRSEPPTSTLATPASPAAAPESTQIPTPEDLEAGNGERAAGAATTLFNGSALT